MNIYSLKLKLFGILLLILSTVLLLQFYYFTPQFEQIEQQETFDNQQRLAQQLAANFEISFQQTVAEIEAIAKLPAITSMEPERISHTLAEMDSVTQFFNYYFIVDPDGTWISYPSKPHLQGKKIKTDYWISDALQKKATVFLDVHPAKTINTLVSGFVTPIHSEDGKISGLIRGVISISEKNALVEQIRSIKIGDNGYVYLVDSNGKLLAHPNVTITPENADQYVYSDFLPVQEALQGEAGVTEYAYEGQDWVAAYQPIPTTGWALIVQQPKKNVVRHVKEEIKDFTGFLILSPLLITVCLAVFFLYSLNPLTRLLRAIRSGQHLREHQFPRDEIGILAQEFQKHSEQLEEKVSQRTEELRFTNDELSSEIAERIKVEKNLLERESTLRSILKAAPVGIGLVHNRVFSWVSEQVLQLTGYTEEELIGKSARIVYPSQEEFEKVGRIKYGQLRQHAEVGELDTVWQKKDGTLVDVHLRSTPINPDDLSEGVTFSVLNITERKKMELDLQRAQKLESLGILAGGIAHDFNNLLQSIIGNLSLAKMYVDKNDKVYDKLTETEKAASRATSLTLQLLTFAKGGAPIKTTTHIAHIIKNGVSFTLQGSNVTCDFSLHDDLWPVDVDEGQFNQVIQNLVINAIHAMPGGGRISVHAENCSIGPANGIPLDHGQYVNISIQDYGVGIPEEHLTHIFDPYYSTKQTGSGLGLAVAYSVIKNHSGLLTVESEAGKGATFHIYLPASGDGHQDISEKAEADIHSGEGRVLVMDDEVLVLEIAVEMLEILGYEVTTCQDGSIALNLYREAMAEQPYDFVILDLTVPGGMGGEETVAKLLELDPDTKAFVSSGYANDPIMAEYSTYGFCGVIPKPYTIENLSNALNMIKK